MAIFFVQYVYLCVVDRCINMVDDLLGGGLLRWMKVMGMARLQFMLISM